MKKLMLPLAVICLFTVSCSKQNNDLSGNANQASTQPTHVLAKGSVYKVNARNVPGPNPCDKTVVKDCVYMDGGGVKAPRTHLDAITAAIAQGPVAVGNLFSGNDIPEITGSLDASILTPLSSGEYTLQSIFENDDLIKYYAGTPAQLDRGEFAFALQLTKLK